MPPTKRARRPSPVARDHDALAHNVACDGIELLGQRLRALLRSPKQDGALINQYADALVTLHGAARLTRTPLGVALEPQQPGALSSAGSTSALVVPGVINDRATWERVYASSVAAVKRVVDEAARAVAEKR